jgi:hypothetical protein
MANESFQQVYESVCHVLGTEPQSLEPDIYGRLGFGLQLGEVQVHIAATNWTPPGGPAPVAGLLMLVEFGAADPANECETLAEVLDANLLLAASGGPVFSRNPIDGCLLLQQVFPLPAMSGERLQATAQQLALLAQTWRDGRLPGHRNNASEYPAAGSVAAHLNGRSTGSVISPGYA